MKNISLLFGLLLFAAVTFAQAPQAFKYQAVARDVSGVPLENQQIAVKISILSGEASGELVYSERHETTTNGLGLFDLEIGNPDEVLAGSFQDINWGIANYFLKVEMDETGGTNYQLMGVSQLLSVPYALFAEKSFDNRWKVNEDDIYYLDGSIGIGLNDPDNSAELDVSSTSKGFLPPRMTYEQRDAIQNPAEGLMVFCTNCSSNGAISIYKNGIWRIYLPDASCNVNTPTSGSHFAKENQIHWYWNIVAGATGYKWNTLNDNSTAIDMGSNTSFTEVGLECSTTFTRYVWAYNSCGISLPVTMIQTTPPCFTCGNQFKVNHTSGIIAPVSKTVYYGTVTNIPGETSKCWISQNLGANHQAASAIDVTEASAGWYWQFNRKQGYMHDGVSRIPNTTWISSIDENSDWLQSNDPCANLLSANWRLPTQTEWFNVDNIGGWNNYNDAYNSNLKLHTAGYLHFNDNGQLHSRGDGHTGMYWSSSQDWNIAAKLLSMDSYSYQCQVGEANKAYGSSVRCLTDSISYSQATLPTVTTAAISNILLNTASGGGEVTNDGGAIVTARGICWSNVINPTIANNHTFNGYGTGVFTSNLTVLQANTQYFVRAFATNRVGTAYGDEVTFTTLENAVLPTIATTAISLIAQTSAVSGGNITSDGGSSIIARGICWNTLSNPTTADYHTIDGTGKGEFISNFYNLTPNTLYFARAYATNSIGIVYGNEVSFTTSQPCSASITINHIAGAVAPVNKTVTYDIVSNITGEPGKCWISQNLGAANQATAVNDATEASSGWYWQFNRKQGYKHDGTTRTPNTPWITSINENSDWLPANDPCSIELGSGWRIPTKTEWTNVDAWGNWTNWNGPWDSELRLHAAGDLYWSDGLLYNRGYAGYYWSSTQFNELAGWLLPFHSGSCSIGQNNRSYGYSLRCLKD